MLQARIQNLFSCGPLDGPRRDLHSSMSRAFIGRYGAAAGWGSIQAKGLRTTRRSSVAHCSSAAAEQHCFREPPTGRLRAPARPHQAPLSTSHRHTGAPQRLCMATRVAPVAAAGRWTLDPSPCPPQALTPRVCRRSTRALPTHGAAPSVRTWTWGAAPHAHQQRGANRPRTLGRTQRGGGREGALAVAQGSRPPPPLAPARRVLALRPHPKGLRTAQ